MRIPYDAVTGASIPETSQSSINRSPIFERFFEVSKICGTQPCVSYVGKKYCHLSTVWNVA